MIALKIDDYRELKAQLKDLLKSLGGVERAKDLLGITAKGKVVWDHQADEDVEEQDVVFDGESWDLLVESLGTLSSRTQEEGSILTALKELKELYRMMAGH